MNSCIVTYGRCYETDIVRNRFFFKVDTVNKFIDEYGEEFIKRVNKYYKSEKAFIRDEKHLNQLGSIIKYV